MPVAATTSKISSTEGSGKNTATASFTEDAVTKELARIGAEYDSTPPTMSTGQFSDLQCDVNANLKVSLATLIAGEDMTNNVLKTEGQYTPSALLAADGQVKGAAGFIHSVTFMCNDAAPTAGSIIIYNSLTETGTQVFNHTFTTTPFMPFTVILDIVMTTGIYVGFTTTADVNVLVSYR